MTQSPDISRESTNFDLVQADSIDSIKVEKGGKQPLAGFLFFGCVGLLCFNFFLQSLMYFDTCFSKDFSQYANIIYGFSNNCGQLLVIFYGGNFLSLSVSITRASLWQLFWLHIPFLLYLLRISRSVCRWDYS